VKRFLILYLFTGFIFSANIFPQVNNFKIYSIDQGLPVSTIFTMIRDSRGYLWLGTIGGGVSRFDGYSFFTFNQKNGLPDNNVRTILEDSKGHLWFGTYGGVSFYDGYSIRNIDKNDGLSGEQVWSLFEDRKNRVWAGTDNALNKVEFFHSFDSIKITPYSLMEGLAARLIFDIYEDKYNRLWLATYRNGIFIVSFENEEISNIKRLSGSSIPSDNILAIEEDKEGNLWFATEDAGVFKIEGFTDSSWGHIEVYNSSNGLPDNKIWDILSDEAGNLWFATDKGGIVKLVNKKFMEYSVKQGFPENQVLCIEQDSEGNIWAGTFSFGIVKMIGDHFSHYMEEQGLSSNQIYDIDQDEQGNYWLASLGAGLIKLSFENGNPDFFYYTTQNGLPDNYINSLSFDTNGNLWVGTNENGICRFDGYTFKNFTMDNALIDNHVICILADSRGDLWIGTKSGISRYNGIGFFPITADEFGLPHNDVQTIIEDKEGRIWVGTYDGLARFDENNIMQTFDEEEGLNFKQIFALAEDTYGNIWIGTHGGGLYKWDKNADLKQSIKFIVGDSLLGSNNIVSMVFQDDSTLLVGTNVGFDKVILDKDQNIQQVKNYNKSNGFIGMENNLNAILKDNEDNIWFGTVKGITRFNPMLEKINLTPPKLHLTGLDLEFENIDWSEKVDSILPYSLLPFDLKLPHHQNHLTFKWTGIYLGNPEEVRYKYKLYPQEKDWSPSRIMSEMTYSGLNPGEYTFMVIAENENGIWNEEPLTFNFIIKPPFYQTWWFITIVIILIIIAIITFIKYREKQLIKEKRILEQKVNERTAEIQRQKTHIEEQKDIIEKKNIDITDSIRYAKRIQNAILPADKLLKDNLRDYFILFLPKDIVSGDFYWVKEKNASLVIIAADCTGHGVPGAFMSMLGITLLNEIVEKDNITSPDRILNTLREDVITSLKQKGVEGESKDGMDIAVCTVDKKTKKISFAGANNPLYLVRNDELFETKGDRMPVAIHTKMENFTKHEIEVIPGDSLYIFSDGFADQFGGTEGKKFKYKQFKQTLLDIRDKEMKVQGDLLTNTFNDWRGDCEQIDDIVILGFKV
jgi:ligand-binding sensor domain-containing protein/serine phosphatase RsbU (regulator of sigma subunit)